MPVAVPLIGAAATIGGGLLASSATKHAANTAAAAQTASDQAAIAEQQRQFNTTNANLAPYRQFGQSALGPQGDLLGLNGNDAQQAAISSLQASPLYQSLFQNGQNTILANASATGGLRGGNTQTSLANFGRDTLATVIENQLNKLSGASAVGENAAAQTGTFGANSANAISSLLAEQGASNAGAALASGAASRGAISDIAGGIAGLANNPAIQNALFGPSQSSISASAAQTIAANPELF